MEEEGADLVTCSDCKHWKEREEEPHTIGPKTLSIGDCYESAFAKTFGKSVTAHDGIPCNYFEKKVSE